MSKHSKIMAEQLIKEIGGAENIEALENCMTRVRITVIESAKVHIENIKKMENVLGVIFESDYLQVIVGPGKAQTVTTQMKEILEIDTRDEAMIRKENANRANNVWYKLILKRIASIFVPIIPAFIACGLIVTIYESTYVYYPGFKETSFGVIMGTVAYSIFSILPIIVGFNTAKEFGGTPVLGAIIGFILSSGGLAGAEIFSVTIVPGRGGVISVLIIVYVATLLEKNLRKRIPNSLDLFLTPFLTISVMTVVGLAVFQPLGGIISESIGSMVSFIIYQVPYLAGIASLIYLPLVVSGMHHGLIAVNTQLVQDFGVTYLLPVTAMAGAGQVGASIGVYMKTKSKRLKRTIKNGLPVGMLGIGEPLLWGVTIPLGKPFLASCLGGAIGGSAMAMMGVAAKVPELGGIPLGFITTGFPLYFVGLLIAYTSGFFFCILLGFEDPID